MTREFFNTQFAALIAAYTYAQKAPEEGQDVYWNCLQKLPPAAFHYAVKKCLQGCKFFPTIAELLETANTAPLPKPKLLDEPQLTEEQRRANLREFGKMLRPLIKQLDVRKEHER